MALTTVRNTGISRLPAISGANLTSLTAGNLTGTLPAISGANLTGLPDEFGMKLLSTHNISDGTSTQNVALTGSYPLYLVTFTNVIPNNNDNTLRHAFTDDNFSSANQQLYGCYFRQEARRDNSTSSSTGHQAATGYVRIADHVGGGNTYEGVSGAIYYAHMTTTAPKASYWGNINSYHQDERMSNHQVNGFADTTNAMNGIAYNYDSGSFKSGQIKLYGMA